MVDVAEVVVRATPEGLQSTTNQVDEMSDGVEDSTDEMDEQAGVMSRLSKRFSGAMGAVMTGMAVATAGLLSQVPVIGELMGGLGAIIDGLAFRLDSLLRPTFGPIVDRLFDFADAIFEADGALGTVIDILLVAGTILGTLAGVVLTVTKVLAPMISSFGVLVTVGKVVVGAIASIIGIIGAVPLAIGLLVAGLALLAWHFREEIVGAIKTAIGWIGDIADRFTDFVSDALEWGVDVLANLVESFKDGAGSVFDWVTGFVSDITESFTDLVSDAFEWGKDLIQRFISGIKSAASGIGEISIVGDLTLGDVAGEVSGALGGGNDSGGTEFRGSVGGNNGGTYLDGRRVDSNQSRFSKDRLTRRGG